jgi:hypothetical protein
MMTYIPREISIRQVCFAKLLELQLIVTSQSNHAQSVTIAVDYQDSYAIVQNT